MYWYWEYEVRVSFDRAACERLQVPVRPSFRRGNAASASLRNPERV
jgi:hypothetical protein